MTEPAADTLPESDPKLIRRAVEILMEPGSVVELRAPESRRGVVSGYFDEIDKLVAAVCEIDGEGPAVTMTLNAVERSLLARSSNRVKPYAKHTTKDPDGLVDLKKALGPLKGTVGYAAAFVDSPSDRLVELRAGCINGLKIFLNGKEVFAREEYHHGMSVDQYAARGTLKKGRNVILLKVCQNEQEENWAQEWRFQLRLCDPVGAAVPFTSAKAPAREDK